MAKRKHTKRVWVVVATATAEPQRIALSAAGAGRLSLRPGEHMVTARLQWSA